MLNLRKKTGKERTVWITYMAILIAMIVVLTCLPIKTLGLEITIALIPIAIGSVLLDPISGLILGGVYGVCSFLQCFGLLLPSPFGAALVGINPVMTAVTCIVPRLICGFVPGIVYLAIKKVDKTNVIAQVVGCLVCPILNTLFFMSFLMIFFGGTDLIKGFMDTLGIFNPILFVFAFVGINGLVEILACAIIAPALVKVLEQVNKRLI